MRINRVFCRVLAAIIGLPLPTRAWGPVGHKAIAIIAQNRLEPRTLQAIRAIVGRNINLDWIANCADVFAHSQDHFLCAGTIEIDGDSARSKSWHYINIPVSEDPHTSSVMDYCTNGQDCVVAKIRENMRVLRDPAQSRQAKQIALIYLVHLVGDAHQPLHCADDRDNGGNDKFVNVLAKGEAKHLNLHQIWDHMIANPEEASPQPESLNVQAEELAVQLRKELADPRTHDPHEIALWVQGDLPSEMALESFQIAKTTIYPDYAVNQGRIADGKDPHNISQDYQSRMQPIAYMRVKMAGVRLAYMLNLALGQSNQARLDAVPNIPRDLVSQKMLFYTHAVRSHSL